MPSSEKREIRSLPFEIRADENENGERTIEGRAIVYGKRTDLGYFDEIIEPGALDKTDLRDVPLLQNHDTDALPLARSRRNTPRSTMQLIPDAEGLGIRARLDTKNNPSAAAADSAIDRGDVDGMSFAFSVESEEWTELDTEHPTRHITGISRVFEVSIVTWPAYADTSIHARGMATALESAAAALESAKANKAAIEARKRKIKILTEV